MSFQLCPRHKVGLTVPAATDFTELVRAAVEETQADPALAPHIATLRTLTTAADAGAGTSCDAAAVENDSGGIGTGGIGGDWGVQVLGTGASCPSMYRNGEPALARACPRALLDVCWTGVSASACALTCS